MVYYYAVSYEGMEHPWEWQLHSEMAVTPETIPDGLAYEKLCSVLEQ